MASGVDSGIASGRLSPRKEGVYIDKQNGEKRSLKKVNICTSSGSFSFLIAHIRYAPKIRHAFRKRKRIGKRENYTIGKSADGIPRADSSPIGRSCARASSPNARFVRRLQV